jgi:hypothetical protein
MQRVCDQIERLFSYTRQLDAVLWFAATAREKRASSAKKKKACHS